MPAIKGLKLCNRRLNVAGAARSYLTRCVSHFNYIACEA